MSIDKIKTGDDLTQSLDIVSDNISKLKELFPEVLTEGKIDFKVLQNILGNEIEEEEEFYRFTWAGKSQARREAHKPSTGTLRPCKEESVDWDTTQNLYIEGDNLEVLKLLQKSYSNKVKMIYIDPPYNTGNDFIYKDNYKDNLKNYHQITGQIDNEGNRTKTNLESNGRYHSNWLNMMYPRLKLAKNLLTNDGAIFISIDENEIHNLRMLCNDVFGEDNYLTEICIKLRHENRILKGDKDFHEVFEYCLVFRKSSEYKQTKRIEDNSSIDNYRISIQLKGSPVEILNLDGKNVEVYSPNEYEVINHETPSEDFLQSISIRGTLKEGNSSGRFFMKHLNGINGKYGFLYKVPNMGNDKFGYRYIMRQPTESHLNGIYFQGVPLDKKDTKEVPFPNHYDFVDIFNNVGQEGGIEFRNGKKPIKFLKHLLKLGGVESDKNCIVLDFFSGSASTGHALMDLNIDDAGNRKHIQIQIPQKVEGNTESFRDGFLTIADIGKERLRRTINKIMIEYPEKSKKIDLGFKVFKLDSSNIKGWDGLPENLEKSLFDSQDNIKSDRSEEDVLFEILLKYGLDLTLPIEEKVIEGKKVFNVGFGALFICLGNNLTSKVAEGIGQWKETLKPETCRVIFKDGGFTDVEKTNSVQTLKRFGIQEIKSI